MAFGLTKQRKKDAQRNKAVDEALVNVIKDIYQKYSLLQELERTAYEVPEDLYLMRKIEGAKYFFLMQEARQRDLSIDIAAPKATKSRFLKKSQY